MQMKGGDKVKLGGGSGRLEYREGIGGAARSLIWNNAVEGLCFEQRQIKLLLRSWYPYTWSFSAFHLHTSRAVGQLKVNKKDCRKTGKDL